MQPDGMGRLKGALAAAGAAHKQWSDRFIAEMEFAEGLARLDAAKGARWRKLLDEAPQPVLSVAQAGRLDALPDAVRQAEELLAPVGAAAKDYTVYCVGHAHIDMNWMWSWPETVAITADTFTTVLELMEEFSDFCFTQSQASVYEIVRRYRPDLLKAIRRRVAEGRWEVAAVHWVEGDKNLAAGEALARHLLYTRRFMAELFGLGPEALPLDWEPDTFGHAHTIPTIVTRGGVRFYYMCRGGPARPCPVFWWQGPDGARVLTYLETTWYNDHVGPHNAMAMLEFCRRTGLHEWMNVYGVGDRGGGPTRRDIMRAHEMDGWPVFPNFTLSTTHPFYVALEEDGERWEVVDGELNPEFTGCYSSQSRIKRANRLGENYCLEAESAAAFAFRAVDRPYPSDMLREAWTKILFGHFHDILPGSGVPATREYQSGLFQAAAAETGTVKSQSWRAIAEAVDTSFAGEAPPPPDSRALGGGPGYQAGPDGLSRAGHVHGGPRPFILFNPTPWQRADVARVTVWDPVSAVGETDKARMPFTARWRDGRRLPCQTTATGDWWGHDYVELAFPAAVGPMGYAACAVEEGKAAAPEAGARCHAAAHGWEQQSARAVALENEFVLVEFDAATGGIAKLVEKASGRNLAHPDRPMAVLEYVVERPRGMSAWMVNDPLRRICPIEVVSLAPGQRGPYLASAVVKARVERSEATVTFALKTGRPELEIDLRLRWLEIGGEHGTPALRMVFPLALTDPKPRYEIPFGAIERSASSGQMVPALRWADATGSAASGEAAGCALLNDCRYGHSLDGNVLRVTLVRSSSDPDPFPEVGEHEMRLALVPHAGDVTAADLVRMAAEFNHPVRAIPTNVHAGGLPAHGSPLVEVEPPGVALTSLKKREDDDALVFRLLNTTDETVRARVRCDAALLGVPAQVTEVDLLERPVEKPSARAVRGGFSIQVLGRGIAGTAVLFEPGPKA
jgi:alpha-mannosidase